MTTLLNGGWDRQALQGLTAPPDPRGPVPSPGTAKRRAGRSRQFQGSFSTLMSLAGPGAADPVNVEDLAGAASSFSFSPVEPCPEGMCKLGIDSCTQVHHGKSLQVMAAC